MIEKFFVAVFNIVIHLVELLLVPIDRIITNYLPNISNALSFISDFFDTLGSYASIVISYTGLTSTTISIIIGLLTFTLTVPLLVQSFKLAIKWYDKLKV